MFSATSLLLLALGFVLGYDPSLTRRYYPEEENPFRIRLLPSKDGTGRFSFQRIDQQPKYTKVEQSDITFFLYTSENLEEPEIHPLNNVTTMLTSNYYRGNKTHYYIIHGLSGSHASELNGLIKSAILDHFDINVFVVDWSGPASQFYTEARAAISDVGLYISDYLKGIQPVFGFEFSDVRCVGHGLGAHVCGDIGSRVSEFGKIDYIIGLDPAGPLFSLSEPENRLDSTDAQFVHVVHTNGDLLGFKSSIGHVDFFPNGGLIQPGCGIDLTGSCSQDRAYQYFVESLKSSGFRSYLCNSWEEFDFGFCYGNDKAFLGEYDLDVNQLGDFYLHTNEVEPFALG